MQEGEPKGGARFLRVSMVYLGRRMPVDVPKGMSVAGVKEIVKDTFCISTDDGHVGKEAKVLSLVLSGGDLSDDLVFTDLGIRVGATLRVTLKEHIKPVLYVSCAYNQETVSIVDKGIEDIGAISVASFRAVISRKTGLPISVFRLVNKAAMEMFDVHNFCEYSVNNNDMIYLETWDGWGDFLNFCVFGYKSQVMSHLSSDELICRYQMRVALYISAHFGHVDLAVCLLKQGVRADEPVGEHPARAWCQANTHPDKFKCAIHEAAEFGSLSVLRMCVHSSITNMFCKDSSGRFPLNIALQNQQKGCALFLLTKQWTRVSYEDITTIPLAIVARMKKWSDIARDRLLPAQGTQTRNNRVPRRPIQKYSLVGQGVLVDGFSQSQMRTRPLESKVQKTKVEYKDNRAIANISGESESDHLPRLTQRTQMTRTSDGQNFVLNSSVGSSDTIQQFRKTAPFLSKRFRSKSFRCNPSSSSLPSINATAVNSKNDHQHNAPSFGNGRKHNLLVSDSSKRGLFLRTPGEGVTREGQQRQPYVSKSKNMHGLENLGSISKVKSTDTHLLPKDVAREKSRPVNHGRSRSENLIIRETMDLFEGYRGEKPREHAMRYLAIANSFKDKPWLQQVRLAMSLTAESVKKAVERKPHLFADKT